MWGNPTAHIEQYFKNPVLISEIHRCSVYFNQTLYTPVQSLAYCYQEWISEFQKLVELL